MVTADDDCVPERVDIGAAIVHDACEPGEDGTGCVAMAVVKGIWLYPTNRTSKSWHLIKQMEVASF